MDTMAKIQVLAGAARYDASCASSGGKRKNDGGLGNSAAARMGICHSWAADGRCVSLLKVLFSNHCLFDCAYCANRRSNDIPRASFTVRELVDLTIGFYRRNYIEGLFLSTGVFASPDTTMEALLQVARTLRLDERFNGYIHLKVIPGASPDLIRQAGFYADRLSVNIELATEDCLRALAPGKTRDTILKPMAYIGSSIAAHREEEKIFRHAPMYVPAGQSTQLIVGAAPESDRQIITLAEQLYRRVNLRRVYYSAYIPVNERGLAPGEAPPPFRREHRIYQADWLLRFYGFKADEIFAPDDPFLSLELEPKTAWALRHPERFPVEINRADLPLLLRTPGIGLVSARRIVEARRRGQIRPEDLPGLGVVMKRAKYFITCRGKAFERLEEPAAIRARLLVGGGDHHTGGYRQLSLF
ncbi:MAG: putative DNA modification/repair radical SAM protein [Patescibacteria group bacterium]